MACALLHNQGGLHHRLDQQPSDHKLNVPLLFIKSLWIIFYYSHRNMDGYSIYLNVSYPETCMFTLWVYSTSDEMVSDHLVSAFTTLLCELCFILKLMCVCVCIHMAHIWRSVRTCVHVMLHVEVSVCVHTYVVALYGGQRTYVWAYMCHADIWRSVCMCVCVHMSCYMWRTMYVDKNYIKHKSTTTKLWMS